jgi:hypothetical protein
MRKLYSWIVISGICASLTGRDSLAQSFDDVWEIMNQERGPESPGCRGCHIRPGPPKGLVWGDSMEEVLEALQTPDSTGVSLVDGGNGRSILSIRLECGSMPFFGRRWHEGPDDTYPDEFYQFQLEKLRAWLAQFDDPSSDPTMQ